MRAAHPGAAPAGRRLTARGASEQGRKLTMRGEAQQARMVDAAYEIIAERGFEGLRTREVASRAGLNISTFHYYFPSKEDLVRSVAERLLREFKTASSHGSRGDESAREELEREFGDQSRVIDRNPETYVVLMELFVRSLRDAELKPIFNDLLDVWESHINQYVARGVASGELSSECGAAAASRALQCLLLGTAISLLAGRKRVSTEEVRREVSRWLTPGPRTRSPNKGARSR